MTSVSVSVTKLVALVRQLVLELEVVFDDAVVHHHDVARAIAMRMRVLFGGAAVRGPARVPDAVGCRPPDSAGALLPGCAACPSAPHGQAIVAFQHRDARRVVAAVFQALQAVQNDRDRLPISDVADNSAHIVIPLVQELHPVVFHHRIGQHVPRHLIHLLLGLLPGPFPPGFRCRKTFPAALR